MSKINKNKLVPKLRFPEFKDVWNHEQLCNLLDYERPDNYIVKETNYVAEGIPVLTANKSFILGYTQETFGIYNNIPAIIFDDFTVDKKFVDFPFKVKSSAIKILRPKGKDDLKFLFELMSLIKFEAKEHKRYYISAYQNLSVPVPTPAEQQKIAACLSSLDEVIAGERQKLERLKLHKKGLLQNLFPQEGETVPRLRFPEFQDSGEWEEKRLGEIAVFLKGKGISKADVDDKGKQPCIRYGELYTHYGEVIKEIKSFTNLNEEDLMLSEPNDVIIPSSGETKEDIATASCVKLGGVALGGDLNILRSSLNGDFLAYYLSHGLKKAISKIAQGDAVVHLYATQLKKLIIRVPIKKKEQERIADMISSLDDIIKIQNQKLEALQLHKKGLLQGLFPNINDEQYG